MNFIATVVWRNESMQFHWYGLMIGFGVVAALTVAEWVIEKIYPPNTLSPKELHDAFWWVIGFGLVGARLYHVVDYWQYYRDNLFGILLIWNGGLGIYGGIIGGLLGVWCWARIEQKSRLKQRFYGVLDASAVGLLLSQAIGRVGNFINQELYGKPTDLLWKIYIRPENRLPGFENQAYYHPLFWYEAMWNLLGFFGLLRVMHNRKLQFFRGNYFLLYLIWYTIGRTALESLRIHPWSWGGVPVASVLGIAIMTGVGLVIRYRIQHHEWAILVD